MVVCKTNGDVNHHRSVAHARPGLLNPNNPTVGLSSSTVLANGEWLTCSFTRENSNSTVNYFPFTTINIYHVLAAYGSMEPTGTVNRL